MTESRWKGGGHPRWLVSIFNGGLWVSFRKREWARWIGVGGLESKPPPSKTEGGAPKGRRARNKEGGLGVIKDEWRLLTRYRGLRPNWWYSAGLLTANLCAT